MTSIEAPDVLFVLGKGGTGRTTVAASLAAAFANAGESSLLVQWALNDAVSSLYGLPDTHHEVRKVAPHFHVMNYSFERAVEEYFVSHLGARQVFEKVIQSSHIQKLMKAAPGIQELFFLGRIFWLSELCQKERGWRYKRIIVDAPASGHGIPLFHIPQSVARMGIPGPISYETNRVAEFLANPEKVGVAVVATPEELPIEEMMEMLPRIEHVLKREPLFAVLNRCLDSNLFPEGKQHSFSPSTRWWKTAIASLENSGNKAHLQAVLDVMLQRRKQEGYALQQLSAKNIPVLKIPDSGFQNGNVRAHEVIEVCARECERFLYGSNHG